MESAEIVSADGEEVGGGIGCAGAFGWVLLPTKSILVIIMTTYVNEQNLIELFNVVV